MEEIQIRRNDNYEVFYRKYVDRENNTVKNEFRRHTFKFVLHLEQGEKMDEQLLFE